MKAIVTKYLGPTAKRGSRVKASDAQGNRITVSWAYELGIEGNHRRAAEALSKKMGWEGELIAGELKVGYAFVFANSDIRGRRDADN